MADNKIRTSFLKSQDAERRKFVAKHQAAGDTVVATKTLSGFVVVVTPKRLKESAKPKPFESFRRNLSEDVVPFPSDRWQGVKPPPVPVAKPIRQIAVPTVDAPPVADDEIATTPGMGVSMPKLHKLILNTNRILVLAKQMYYSDEYNRGHRYKWAHGMDEDEVIETMMQINDPKLYIRPRRNKFIPIDTRNGGAVDGPLTSASGKFMVALTDIPEKYTAAGDFKTIKAYGVPNYRFQALTNLATVTPLQLAGFAGGSYSRYLARAAAKLGLH